MTTEEAIKIIESARAVVLNNGEYDEAMRMAIEALKNYNVARCRDDINIEDYKRKLSKIIDNVFVWKCDEVEE